MTSANTNRLPVNPTPARPVPPSSVPPPPQALQAERRAIRLAAQQATGIGGF